MLGDHRRVDASADVELGTDAHESRAAGVYQILEDTVGHRLVEGALVPERPHVQFQGLELDAELLWDVVDVQGREIGLAGLRAQTGKLRDAHPDV